MTHVARGPGAMARRLRSLAASAALPEPLLWRADEPAGPDCWERILPLRDATGLWPVLLGVHVRGTTVEEDLLPPPRGGAVCRRPRPDVLSVYRPAPVTAR
ncbi:hypothetical protein [Streptomyces sp. CNQ085]|uniref:hypothetical protein n=1 Tax=Streptomyces sp. CNQ085 TaxID=2886944 RepID=UPI001F515128|nr:hypothetical protein [Streptomyces sp. CNQ085]MCI0386616.1 hypothetical protein [Streptomyces sp. CNQ085]